MTQDKIKESSLARKALGLRVIQIIQNILVKKRLAQKAMMVIKELILKKEKINLKTEVDLNHLNLKSIEKTVIN